MIRKPQIPIAQIGDERKVIRVNGLDQSMPMVLSSPRRFFKRSAFNSRIIRSDVKQELFGVVIDPIPDDNQLPIRVGLLPN